MLNRLPIAQDTKRSTGLAHAHIQHADRLVEQKTGVHYALYGYEGHPEAEYVIVVMGSGAVTCSETAKYLMEKGEKATEICQKVALSLPNLVGLQLKEFLPQSVGICWGNKNMCTKNSVLPFATLGKF